VGDDGKQQLSGRKLIERAKTMRFLLASLIALGFIVGSAGLITATVAAKNDVIAADQPPPGGQSRDQVDDVDSRTDRDHDWWASPFFIGVGILAVILVVITVITMVSRRSGPNVIKG
jgi:hypothetical protein